MKVSVIKRVAPLVAIIAVIIVLAACVSSPKPAATYQFEAKAVKVDSRGVSVPAILTVPVGATKVPLVVMAHGHGGSKEEAGGFTAIAEGLARLGIASIRMDFPGCGESTEPFIQNNLTNMLADIEAARLFALANASVNAKRIGMFGYSMGGRLAIMSTVKTGYTSLGLLAPVATNGPASMFTFMGGKPAYDALAAKAAAEGHVIFTTPYGQVQDLGKKWFDDNQSAICIEPVIVYKGPILYVRGANDTVIAESVVNASAAAANSSSGVEMVTIAGADHGYGFYGGDPQIKIDTVNSITSFFSRTLR